MVITLAALADEVLPQIEDKEEQAEKLTSIANAILQFIDEDDTEMTKKCLRWAKKANKLAPNTQTYETLANIYDRLGNTKEAKKYRELSTQ